QRIGLGAMLKNWALVWVANLFGSLFIAVLIAGLSGLLDGKVGHTAVYVAAAKASLPLGQVFVRGILANWLVCMAIVMALSAQEAGGKVLAIFFPVLTFVASGFEHSVANMYFMPAGLIAQAHFGEVPTVLTVGNALRNIAGATAGNIVGGGLFVALFFVWMERSVKKKV
ncbi:MAG: formate/nitrite transporter family protein, partial [Spirochaetales bacterium]|nr:formate/nitrite transporter family protein [Spirochaetales bacterium]